MSGSKIMEVNVDCCNYSIVAYTNNEEKLKAYLSHFSIELKEEDGILTCRTFNPSILRGCSYIHMTKNKALLASIK